MKPNTLIWIAGAMALLGLMSFGAFLMYQPPGPPPPVMGSVPAFELMDEEGEVFSSESLKGKVWVADFFFSKCPGPCPKMSAHMKQLNQIYQDNPSVAQVSITVDPKNDTPEIMKRYGKRLKASFASWHFLTGEAEMLHQIAVEGFKIGDPDSLINHSTKFVLVDQLGRIRGYFEGTNPVEIESLNKVIRQVLKEKSTSNS